MSVQQIERGNLPLVGQGLVLPYDCTTDPFFPSKSHEADRYESVAPQLLFLFRDEAFVKQTARNLGRVLFELLDAEGAPFATALEAEKQFSLRQHRHLSRVATNNALGDEAMSYHDDIHYVSDLQRSFKFLKR